LNRIVCPRYQSAELQFDWLQLAVFRRADPEIGAPASAGRW